MSGKRIVQFVKTFDGALWAIQQVKILKELGWDVHIVSPTFKGRYLDAWKESGATLHELPCEYPVKAPWKLSLIKNGLRSFIQNLNPDLIHSHFVSTTLMLRYALDGLNIPCVFQVPGPLHLEHSLFGQWETSWAGANDYWIASSRYIKRLYEEKYSINPAKVHLSYYGTDLSYFVTDHKSKFREKYGIPEKATVFGNVSFIYPPKIYLGQRTGLKGHELMIEALLQVMQGRDDVWAVFIGQQWGPSQRYFEKIKNWAQKKSDRFIFTGYLPQKEILTLWKDFDFALHLPSSENCGGVIEPMINGIPTIASNVGGLPEVVINDKTGLLTERNTSAIVSQLMKALNSPEEMVRMGKEGKELVTNLFDIRRTATEVSGIYERILKEYK